MKNLKTNTILVLLLALCFAAINAQTNITTLIKGEGNATESNSGFSFSSGNSVRYTTGKFGKAFLLDGSSDAYLTKPLSDSDTVAKSLFDTSLFTFEAWIKTASSGGNTLISYNYQNDVEFAISEPNALKIKIKAATINTQIAFNSDSWTHLAITWSSQNGNLVVYKNGDVASQLQNVEVGKQMRCCQGNVTIGQDSFDKSTTKNWVGEVDEIYMHNTVRSRKEILKHIGNYCNLLKDTDPNVCNKNGKCVSFDKCSCFSGYYGEYCDKKGSATNCKWNAISKLKTDFYPKIDDGKVRFFNDRLYLSVKSPLVTDRLDTQLFIEDENNANCKFPGNYWSQGYDDVAPCYNTFNSEIPWVRGKTCGWRVSDTPEQKIYSGNLFVKQTEKIGDLRGTPITRSIKSVIPLRIRFQKTIELSYSVKVFAPVDMLAAITKQEYIPGPPHAGLFNFVTQLQYPFMVDESAPIVVQQIPAPITTQVTADPGNTCTANAPCLQTFILPITTNGACSFTGQYRFKLKLKCHPSITNPADCPLPSTTESFAEVQIDINSEDFCSVVSIDIKLQGKLEAFEDAQYQIKKDAFLLNQTAHFQATLNSPQATLIESTVKRVQLIQANRTNVLYDGGVNTNFGNLVEFKPDAGGATTCGFNFKFSQAHTPVPVDESADFKVTSLIEVKYASIENAAPNQVRTFRFTRYFFKNNAVAQQEGDTGSQDSKYESPVKLTGKVDPSTIKSSASRVFSSGAMALLSVLFLYIFN